MQGELSGDFLQEGLEEGIQRNTENLDQSGALLLHAHLCIQNASMCQMSAHVQLSCTQPLSVTRFVPTVLVRGKE